MCTFARFCGTIRRGPCNYVLVWGLGGVLEGSSQLNQRNAWLMFLRAINLPNRPDLRTAGWGEYLNLSPFDRT